MGKKRVVLFFMLLLLGFSNAIAQRVITGKVVGGDGLPILGATVGIKGSTAGTISGEDGSYRLKVPAGVTGDTIVISFMGMKNYEEAINGRTVINAELESDDVAVDEVVVTAMGISREKRALGYAVTDVDGDDLTKSRGGLNNPVNALQGKVAGLQISSGAGSMGGSSKVLIRGANSLSGSNQPLFVIDGVPIEGGDFNSTNTQRGGGGYDYGNLIQDINPDDIENISVLKGASASALYGSRASNGVVMITTKKAKRNEGLTVDFSSTLGFEVVSKLPKLQNQYGGGYNSYDNEGNLVEDFGTVTINGVDYTTVDYGMDESWGPKFDGREVLSWYDLAKWEANGKQGNPTTSKWEAASSDYDEFFKVGISQTSNIAVSQSLANSSFRISYSNSTLKGYIPNSKQVKNSFNASGNLSGLDKKLNVFTNVSYLNTRTQGRQETGYGDNNFMVKFTQWGQRQLNINELEDLYIMPDGTQASWNRSDVFDPTPAYHNNPYWSVYKDYENDERNRIYGNAGVSYQILPFLKAQYKSNLDFFVDKRYERIAVGSQIQSSYLEISRQQYEINHEFLLTFDKRFNKFGLTAFAGANIMKNRFEYVYGTTVGGIAIPDFYNLKNSLSTAESFNTRTEKGINSVFGDITLSWNDMLYLEGTIRTDKSSTLPEGNNVYTYPSVTFSWLFSELLGDLPWLEFGKARVGFAKVGNDTDAYSVYNTYTAYTHIDSSAPGYRKNQTLNNKELKPESTTSWEAGLELSLFKKRLGFDVTYYQTDTKNEIVPLAVSGSTGFLYKVVNSGEIENKGIEVALHGSPIKTENFEWRSSLTLASNKNKVKKLADGVDYYKLASGPFKVEVGAKVGEEYGVIMGTDFVYDENGNKVVGDDGLYLQTEDMVNIGNIYPDFTGGWSNTFTYKGFDLNVLLDFSKGGHYFSTTQMWGYYCGMFEETAANGVRETGIVSEGVTKDGEENTQVVDAKSYFEHYYNGPAAQNVLKSDYLKLREVSLGYTFNLKRNSFVKALRLSAYGRNLAVWGPDVKHFDPEMIVTNSGNVQGIEGGATPMVTSFGFTVNLKF